MNSLSMIRRARSVRAFLATLGAAAALVSFGPGDALAQRPARAEATRSAPAAAATETGVVNIQTASQEQLELLPGIGPSKAQAIVAQRERQAFRRVEDILRVRGIGRATFRRLRPMLTVQGPTTLTTTPAMPRATAAADEGEDDAAQE